LRPPEKVRKAGRASPHRAEAVSVKRDRSGIVHIRTADDGRVADATAQTDQRGQFVVR
jgi:acyl-homoserine lactone acylase PvdQ